jgi:hypothetical protein
LVRTDATSFVPLTMANADVVSRSRSGKIALVLNRQGTIEIPDGMNNMDLPLARCP